jgi:hypothetical protein
MAGPFTRDVQEHFDFSITAPSDPRQFTVLSSRVAENTHPPGASDRTRTALARRRRPFARHRNWKSAAAAPAIFARREHLDDAAGRLTSSVWSAGHLPNCELMS